MSLKINSFYRIVLEPKKGVVITYTCRLTDIDDLFIYFIDKFDKEYSFRKAVIQNTEEITEAEFLIEQSKSKAGGVNGQHKKI